MSYSKRLLKVFSFFTFFLISFCAYAIPTDKAQLTEGSRIVLFNGTFSPPHLRHHEHVEKILESGAADYVLIIPNDVTPHKPFALSSEIRLRLLMAAYQDHPRVLVPHSTDLGFPISKKVRNYLNQKFQNLQWLAVLGKDSLQNKWAVLGAYSQKVEKWLLLTPDEGDEKEIPKTLGGKVLERIYSPTDHDIHSKDIREAASQGDLQRLEEYVFPSVAKEILELSLYKHSEPKPKLKDYLRSCRTILGKYLK
jgi:nicotinic acid mononucleotide adenylyltransferase